MTEFVTIPAGSTVGNCPACGFVIDDDVATKDCGTGFDCGVCGQFTTNDVAHFEDEYDLPEASVAPETIEALREVAA